MRVLAYYFPRPVFFVKPEPDKSFCDEKAIREVLNQPAGFTDEETPSNEKFETCQKNPKSQSLHLDHPQLFNEDPVEGEGLELQEQLFYCEEYSSEILGPKVRMEDSISNEELPPPENPEEKVEELNPCLIEQPHKAKKSCTNGDQLMKVSRQCNAALQLVETGKGKPDEEGDDDFTLGRENLEMTAIEYDSILLNVRDLFIGSEEAVEDLRNNQLSLKAKESITLDDKRKHVEIKIIKEENFPEGNKTENVFVTLRVEEWRGSIYNKKKLKTKKILSDNPEWNQVIAFDVENIDDCLITLKVKKSENLGMKTSTIGLSKLFLSDFDNSTRLPMLNDTRNQVGKALRLEIKLEDVPKKIASRAEIEKNERKMNAKMILCERHGITPYASFGSNQTLSPIVKPKSAGLSQKINKFLTRHGFSLLKNHYIMNSITNNH